RDLFGLGSLTADFNAEKAAQSAEIVQQRINQIVSQEPKLNLNIFTGRWIPTNPNELIVKGKGFQLNNIDIENQSNTNSGNSNDEDEEDDDDEDEQNKLGQYDTAIMPALLLVKFLLLRAGEARLDAVYEARQLVLDIKIAIQSGMTINQDSLNQRVNELQIFARNGILSNSGFISAVLELAWTRYPLVKVDKVKTRMSQIMLLCFYAAPILTFSLLKQKQIAKSALNRIQNQQFAQLQGGQPLSKSQKKRLRLKRKKEAEQIRSNSGVNFKASEDGLPNIPTFAEFLSFVETEKEYFISSEMDKKLALLSLIEVIKVPPSEFPGNELYTHVTNTLHTVSSIKQQLDVQIAKRIKEEEEENQKRINTNIGTDGSIIDTLGATTDRQIALRRAKIMRQQRIHHPILNENINQGDVQGQGSNDPSSALNQMILTEEDEEEIEEAADKFNEELLEEDIVQLDENAPLEVIEEDFMTEEEKEQNIEKKLKKKNKKSLKRDVDDDEEEDDDDSNKDDSNKEDDDEEEEEEEKKEDDDEDEDDDDDDDKQEDDDEDSKEDNDEDDEEEDDDILDSLPLKDADICVAAFDAFTSFCSVDGEAKFRQLLDNLLLPARQTIQQMIDEGHQKLLQKGLL
ncbi:MAG: hypothetical protein EZS28_006432, partial [Streblomastix strix]